MEVTTEIDLALRSAFEMSEDKHAAIDQIEKLVNELPYVYHKITDHFTDGLYAREMEAGEGAIIVSKIHKTEHPYILSRGMLAVYEGEKVVIVKAPFFGITKPGTRRVAFVMENCTWVTIHSNPDNETVDQIEERIIEKRANKSIELVNLLTR